MVLVLVVVVVVVVYFFDDEKKPPFVFFFAEYVVDSCFSTKSLTDNANVSFFSSLSLPLSTPASSFFFFAVYYRFAKAFFPPPLSRFPRHRHRVLLRLRQLALHLLFLLGTFEFSFFAFFLLLSLPLFLFLRRLKRFSLFSQRLEFLLETFPRTSFSFSNSARIFSVTTRSRSS